ncbi:zinc ribbon domain-containing protein [Poritiphilus flavus]|uniref:Putative zinc ribbon domain-containing protein n=1 Tax=Poritiphilus flavus TaxID=2697053 RepID=A0A6L9EBL1_9FLAO|nr:zinc ribbon domain-containing protein [Poritiphilus flavus]NAS11938.1 hypothetical protein [Poritiphilus flavus]
MKRNRCLNCGRVILRLLDFGTNRDLSVNTDYCRHCLHRGQMKDLKTYKSRAVLHG